MGKEVTRENQELFPNLCRVRVLRKVIENPPNAIIHSSGFVTGRDFLKARAILSVISMIVMVFVMKVYWIGILDLD